MNTFDMPEFTKSAFAMGLGMCAFVGLVAWRTQGNLAAICMSGGLPLGVFSLWAVHVIRMRFFVQLKNVPRARRGKASSFGLDGHSRHALHAMQSYARPTLTSRARAVAELNKERLLSGRQEASVSEEKNQWYQG